MAEELWIKGVYLQKGLFLALLGAGQALTLGLQGSECFYGKGTL